MLKDPQYYNITLLIHSKRVNGPKPRTTLAAGNGAQKRIDWLVDLNCLEGRR